ncbi:hypothetical protein SAMN05660297_02220 [Natronincola peptidivorans]|uniref:Uncharacterized protein n=1 Tax=Natronincola peptidivorans TaxID=426128 RepID=A0A1I0DZV9_9FIRM|nr:hypothetical protein [Natronincola peptidivorans]SET37861.1 hypothetical protein SAMN05660297_02220 [Natronincola peptidivorans]
MHYKWKRIFALFIVSMFVFAGISGSIAYAEKGAGGNRNVSVAADRTRDQIRDQIRDKDCVEEPRHQYCNKDITIDCDQDRLRQRLWECNENCECINDYLRERTRLHLYWEDYVDNDELPTRLLKTRSRLQEMYQAKYAEAK